jgi:hypothetical protein
MKIFDFIIKAFKQRLPVGYEIISVFNVLLFVVFGWSIRGFLFELPSFLLDFQLEDIASILFYMLAFALLESLFITAGLVLVSMVFPSNWLKMGFGYKGFLIIFVATIGLILYQGYYKNGFFETFLKNDYSPLNPLFIGLIVGVFVLIGLFWLFNNKSGLKNYLLIFIAQFSVFAYIYIPLGLIGVLVVIFRNIL